MVLLDTQVLSYVFFRNGVGYFRGFYSGFLNEAGSLSVWLFVCHYHILLASNGQGLLVFWPKLYYVNAAVVSFVFVYLFLIVKASVLNVKTLIFSKTGSSTSNV